MAHPSAYQRRAGRTRGRMLSADTVGGLIIIVLLAIAGLSAFALLDLAGPFGGLWQRVLGTLFGWGRWLFPVLLVALAALRIRPPAERHTGIITFGLLLFVFSVTALLDTVLPLDGVARRELAGAGGGYVGLFLRFPLETVFGPLASGIILIALFLTAIIIIFDVTLGHLGRLMVRALLQPGKFVAGFFSGVAGERADDSMQEPEARFAPLPVSVPDEDEVDDEEDAHEEEVNTSGLPGLGTSPERRRRARPVAIDLPLDLLKPSTGRPTSGDIVANRDIVRRTLASFGIPVEMGEVSVGPTVTQYTLKPEEGVKLSAITALHNDLALALAAHPIRIEAPIPGKSLVGIEVPNRAVARVQLRDILQADAFQKRSSNLALALGKDVTGAPWVADLERMPHLLVAGATGSGKSVALNAIIVSLLYQNNPSDLKFILVDPKRVEFTVYQHMPHLLTPIITAVPATVNALKWLLGEMDRRFDVLAASGHRNIQSYNLKEERMSYIVLVIDELADLMVAAAAEVEAAIIRLAQMSRAVGIHLVLATQRPSVDVITGLIKANVTARVAFSVASLTDSRTILDAGGAEKLLGRGDLLYVSAEVTKPRRLQGAYVGDEELVDVVTFLKNKAAPEYVNEVAERQSAGAGGFSDAADDPLYNEAKQLVVQSRKASASYLQRRLKVGYARAARLIDMLEAQGVVGPGEGAKPRDVLLAPDSRDILDAEDDSDLDEGDNQTVY